MRGEEFDDSKAKLVREICSISTIFTCCSHLPSKTPKPVFVDWYLILRVDEDSGLDVVRRRYRQLALQLHPDKNRHPKAEVAFKLVSEAYECLSDKGRRKSFNSKRQINFCKDCHLKFEHTNAPKNIHKDTPRTKQYRVLRAFREVQSRLKEECRVIESCLRANKAVGKEFPLFDPSDHLLFSGYPHRRTRLFDRHQPGNYSYFGTTPQHWGHRRVRCESPVYQLRSENMHCWSSRF